jgi:hypothetical protein
MSFDRTSIDMATPNLDRLGAGHCHGEPGNMHGGMRRPEEGAISSKPTSRGAGIVPHELSPWVRKRRHGNRSVFDTRWSLDFYRGTISRYQTHDDCLCCGDPTTRQIDDKTRGR